MKRLLWLTISIIIYFPLLSQSYKDYKISRLSSVNISKISVDWEVQLNNLGSPFVANNIYKSYLQNIKEETAKKYPRKTSFNGQFKNYEITSSADTPVVVSEFEGNLFTINDGVPNDNTLAISNDGILVSAVNSNIYMFDINNDTLLKKISLSGFSDTLGTFSHQYDPKLIYDPSENRFIIVYLAGFTDSTSNIVVGFSQTGDPTGFWNMYLLSGNPLNDTSWTDYPSVAISNCELFITVNLLKNMGDTGIWQNSFKQTIIWQIDKHNGYSGDSINTRLWENINYNGNPLRNLAPIQGGDNLYGPDMYLLSDKNFDISNDTIFIVHISDSLYNNPILTVTPVISDKHYGMPPDARQSIQYLPYDTIYNVLATNDARILGGFYQNGKIQFVANSIDHSTGYPAVYHGIIDMSDITVNANIISDTALDFGYPNISYSGINSDQAIITFNHTSPTVKPGFSGIYYNGNDEYSQRITIKEGSSYVNMLSGTYERWGDYTGSQRRVSEDTVRIWVSGFFGRKVSVYYTSGTWIAELQNPADEAINITKQLKVITYPNPADDIVNFKFELPKNAVIEISVFDTRGKLVKTLFNSEAKPPPNTPNTIKEKSRIVFSQKLVVG